MKKIFFFILLFLASSVSFGEVFKWVDERGGVHFTDDVLQVPPQYRPKTERREMPEVTVDQQKQGESEAVSKVKGDSSVDQAGRGEKYWRDRVKEWKKKLVALQERVETLRMRYNDLTERMNDSKRSAGRSTLRRERDLIRNEIEQSKIQIEEARNMIEKKIPEEAELYKARPEWIQ